MSELISNLLVILLVAASAAYALWRLGPQALRRWLRAQYCRLRSIEDQPTGGLSACDVCGACGTHRSARRRSADRTKTLPIR